MKKTLILFLFAIMIGSLCAVTVHDIQFTEDPSGESPYLLQVVTIEEAVVVGVGWKPNGGHASFFVVDPDGGPWSGVYVYDYDEAYVWSVSEGDLVTITATVDEYYGFTELGYIEECDVIGQGTVPAPCEVNTADIEYMEAYESCLVQVDDVTVTEAQDDYGLWRVTDGSGSCNIDDSFFYLDDIDPPIVINVDDFWGRIVGMVSYSYDEYSINPRYPEDLYPNSHINESVIDVASVTLNGNYPNPFNPVTRIDYTLQEGTTINLSVYDVAGRLVKTLYTGAQSSGDHFEIWDGTDNNGSAISSGIYFSRISYSTGVDTNKMLLLK
ncbi:MAG: T9SS type A sorting domain-containing protein [Candidatus Cloacimonetes bacterium]|nr:T9SS type A sorting domain-containing protein [Candidatus Cloacimonadota bacterium]